MVKKAIIASKDLEIIKTKLQEEKDNIEKELQKFSKQNPNNPDDYQTQFQDMGEDETDNVSEVAQYSLDLSLEETLEKSLRDVKKAIKALNDGNYGICKYCGEPINVERLKARPTSTSCITCKTKLKSL